MRTNTREQAPAKRTNDSGLKDSVYTRPELRGRWLSLEVLEIQTSSYAFVPRRQRSRDREMVSPNFSQGHLLSFPSISLSQLRSLEEFLTVLYCASVVEFCQIYCFLSGSRFNCIASKVNDCYWLASMQFDYTDGKARACLALFPCPETDKQRTWKYLLCHASRCAVQKRNHAKGFHPNENLIWWFLTFSSSERNAPIAHSFA